jgi:putative ABC transport system permease protein
MLWPRRLVRRLRALMFRRRVERSMEHEIRQHLEAETAHRVALGMSPGEARRSALVDFGGIESVKERGRDARGGRGVEDLVADVRYAGRVLRRNPGYAAVAILTFALGAGAGTAIFSVVYGVLMRPLPYANPQALVALWERDVRRHRDENVVSAENFEAWRDRARSFTGMAALMPSSLTIASGGDPARVSGAEVSPGYFGLLGVGPALGHEFTEDEARGGKVIVLSDGLWRERFGADPTIVGRSIAVGADRMTVAGVMPASFQPPEFGWLGEQRYWLPLVPQPAWGRYLLVVARLKPGVTIDAARAEMAALGAERARESAANVGWSAWAMPLAAQISGDVRPSLVALLVGVTLLVVMAVTNVAVLTLSAMQRRGLELSVRRALGATDRRLFRQLFSQSALVGGLGTAAGLALAVPATRGLVAGLPPDVPRAGSIALDLPVLLVMCGVMALATVLFGTAAARRGRRTAGAALMGRGDGDARTTARSAGATLVSAEIALAMAIGVIALLLVRSVADLRRVDLGFNPSGVEAVRLALPDARYGSADSQRAFFTAFINRLEAIPGVHSASVISGRPFGGIGPATSIQDARAPQDPAAAPVIADVRFVGPHLLQVLDIPLIDGRFFDGREAAGPLQVVISESLARTIWPGGHAVGRHLAMNLMNDIAPEVIGVIGDVHLVNARTPVRPLALLSVGRFPDVEQDVLVRTAGPPDAIVPALRAALAAVEPDLPLYRVASMANLVDTSLARDRFTALLLSLFAAAALLLAGVGIFGVFSADVGRRRKEIGLRLALGGSAPGIVRILLSRALVRGSVGIVLGLGLGYALARGMSTLLFGVTPADPLSMLVITMGAVVLTSAATVAPAWQALNSSPLRTLRDE